jgi:hypothetical protein
MKNMLDKKPMKPNQLCLATAEYLLAHWFDSRYVDRGSGLSREVVSGAT